MISTPLYLPPIQPTNWDDWWSLWHSKSERIHKISKNHNQRSARWRGFDIWVKPGIDSEADTLYRAKNVNCPEMFKSIFDNLNLFPIDIDIVRAVSSFGPILPHTDYDTKQLSVRSLIYDNNVRPTFYYLSDNNYKKYQQLPLDTNTWAYWDHKYKHGTDWYLGHSKILIMYYGSLRKDRFQNILDLGMSHFPNYTITV